MKHDSTYQSLVAHQSREAALNATRSSRFAQLANEESANNLFLELELPAPIACELQDNPTELAEFWSDVTHKLRSYWGQKIQAGTMDWEPLKPATIAEKRKKGVSEPDHPLIGESGSTLRMITASNQETHVIPTPEGHAVEVLWGPGPGEDQHPSERWDDLFWGYPRPGKTNSQRASIPQRPLLLDEGAKQLIKEELLRWADTQSQQDPDRFCYEEHMLTSVQRESEAPDASRLQVGSSSSQYLLE
jgi:hypothetical protein